MLTNVKSVEHVVNQNGIQKHELINLREVCGFLKCHPNTLRAWDRKGILKAVRIGVRVDRRYRKEDVVVFINKTQNER